MHQVLDDPKFSVAKLKEVIGKPGEFLEEWLPKLFNIFLTDWAKTHRDDQNFAEILKNVIQSLLKVGILCVCRTQTCC
eukprot:COSAG01_NODE_3812_length_5675_cov_2.804878_6_plen_78_part_00